MLILSRRPTETINFPQLGISVSIVSVKGTRVQVGVDAPPDIRILRQELDTSAAGSLEPRRAAADSRARHEFRNQLNKATLGLHLAQKQLAAGQSESANQTLCTALARLTELEQSAATRPARNHEPVPSRPAAADRVPVESTESVDVLLVEDDQNEQALLRDILELEGYRVRTANNGHEALACLQRFTPRFVLLDMMMPECNGRETLERIRQEPAWRDLPVYAVSGSDPVAAGLVLGNAGLADWFPKPLNAPRLIRHMRERMSNVCV